MNSNAPSSVGSDRLRSLNQPRQLHIQLEQGKPVAVIDNSKRQQIASIQDIWIIEDEWWRQPINRQYFSVLLSNGESRTIYHDRIANTWFAQSY